MSKCDCHVDVQDGSEHRVLKIALTLNASMFVIGLSVGIFAQSTALIADALDMLADAGAYAIALIAIGRSHDFKRLAARINGVLILLLGLGVLADVAHRVHTGSEPVSLAMLIVTLLSLTVNTTVLVMLQRFRHGEVHLRATWICTQADVIANFAVLLSAFLVMLTQSRYPDLIVGSLIALYVIKESIEILRVSRATNPSTAAHGVE